MRRKITQALKSDLVKVSSKTGIATGVKLAASFIVSKVLAILVGPSGIAILGQLSNVGNIIQSLSTGGITIGVTKYVSEYSDDRAAQQKIINNALKITFICSAICTIAVLLSYRYLGDCFFHTEKYNSVILILGSTLFLFSFNSLITSIINGFKNFRLYVIINIATSVISLIATIALVYYWGVYGALLAFVLAPAIVFFISWFLVRKELWLNYRFLTEKFDIKSVKLLSRFSMMALNNAFVAAMAQIAIRSFITGKMSIDIAGIWDGMNKLSAAYMLLITTSIQVYYLPTMSYIKERKLLWKEIIKTEKIILPLTLLMFTLIFFTRGILVNLLFSKDFALMKTVFAYQLVGDLIKVATWIISYTMYAKAMTRPLIITDNLFTITYVAISYILLNNFGYGLNSVYFGYIINNAIALVVMYFFMKNYTSKNHV